MGLDNNFCVERENVPKQNTNIYLLVLFCHANAHFGAKRHEFQKVKTGLQSAYAHLVEVKTNHED